MAHLPARPPGLHDVFLAQARIRPVVVETPLAADDKLSRQVGASSAYLKLECLQRTGSFKVRGAANKIFSLSEDQRKKGVITFSTGNHGKAVAYSARQAGTPAVVCLSEHVPAYRAREIRELGAEISIKGTSQDEAEDHYRALTEQRGLVPVVPFDDPLVIAGQGTIALEVLTKLPETDILLVPLSGGGLLSGIGMVAKTINPGIRVVAVSIERSPAMLESVRAGHPVAVTEKDTVADSLLGGIGRQNHYTLRMVTQYTDEHVVVSEEEIMDGMSYLFSTHRLVAEGAASVGVGALINRKINVAGKRVVALISGSSVEPQQYLEILQDRLDKA